MISLIARLLWLYLHFVGKTSKFIYIGRENRDQFEKNSLPCIYALWHGRQAILIYAHRNTKVSPLISPSRDGEIVARMCAAFGITSVRGSSRKAPTSALLKLLERVRMGYCLGLSPDGPLGPERQVKSGVLYLAQKLNIPIMPLTASFKRKVFLKSWDQFLFPLPFNRVVIIYGEPIRVSSDSDMDTEAKRLKTILDEITLKADDLANSL